MNTEEEARKLWCPMVRHYNGSHNAKGNERIPDGCRCIASDCAMWRWGWTQDQIDLANKHNSTAGEGVETYPDPPAQPIGFCGLTGKP